MDEKDRLIVGALRENSRMSVRDIGRKTGVRPSTVHQRIAKLCPDVIERFTIKTNNKRMGQGFEVFMLIATEEDIDNRIFENAHIKEVYGITGEFDLLLKMKFADVDEFNSFLLDFRKRQKLKKTLTMVATINIKEEV